MLLIAVLLVSCAILACEQPVTPIAPAAPHAPTVQVSDPLAPVEAAAQAKHWVEASELLEQLDVHAHVTTSEIRGDYRYLVGNTFYFDLPGVSNSKELFSQPERWRLLPGLSDASENEEQSKYNDAVRRYAEKYNRELQSLNRAK